MNAVTQFVQEAYNELKKTTWLTRQEAVGSTVAVVILVAIIAAYVSTIDFLLSIILGAVLGR
ncbi:MAG: preprotein translocase subunit SecE [Elusimicrobia bacterium]|nr:preprotein translocase subunit SecE [Elusimicrobiota bacterium]